MGSAVGRRGLAARCGLDSGLDKVRLPIAVGRMFEGRGETCGSQARGVLFLLSASPTMVVVVFVIGAKRRVGVGRERGASSGGGGDKGVER